MTLAPLVAWSGWKPSCRVEGRLSSSEETERVCKNYPGVIATRTGGRGRKGPLLSGYLLWSQVAKVSDERLALNWQEGLPRPLSSD